MKKICSIVCFLASLAANSQTVMNIYQSNGTVLQIPISSIDSITYSVGTPGTLASLTTLPIGNITSTNATTGGNITAAGGTLVTQRGVVWNTSPSPTTANSKTTDGSGTGSYTSTLTGLSANTTYYVRAYAINSAGTAYGNQLSFTTAGGVGTITALNCAGGTSIGTLTAGTAASGVSSTVLYTGGNGGTYNAQTVSSTGIAGLTATLAAGTFTSGAGSLTYTITGTPASSGTANFTLSIGGQTCTLTRTVATGGSQGSAATCGADSVHNASLTYGTMTDQDGNVYRTIQIGTQTWMAENLKASHYRNGQPIALVTDVTAWSALSTGATCWYNNDSATYNCPYGKLYNWYAVVDARHVCPTGWHVPTDAEWTVLTDNLGGEAVAGGQMKSAGTLYWPNPNTAADNSSGFSGLPGGLRDFIGLFKFIGFNGYWWSSTEFNNGNAWVRSLNYDNGNASRFNDGFKKFGFSVRCLRD